MFFGPRFPSSKLGPFNLGGHGGNMKDDMRCEECKNTTSPDEFSCNCLCINCGPCDGECNYENKELENG